MDEKERENLREDLREFPKDIDKNAIAMSRVSNMLDNMIELQNGFSEFIAQFEKVKYDINDFYRTPKPLVEVSLTEQEYKNTKESLLNKHKAYDMDLIFYSLVNSIIHIIMKGDKGEIVEEIEAKISESKGTLLESYAYINHEE